MNEIGKYERGMYTLTVENVVLLGNLSLILISCIHLVK